MENVRQSQYDMNEKIISLFFYLKAHMGAELKDRLCVKRSEWNRLIVGKSIEFNRFEKIMNLMGFSTLCLTTNNIDHAVALKYLLGEKNNVPATYCLNAFSRRRIGRVILETLASLYGQRFVQNLLYSLQIGDLFFSYPNDDKFVDTELYGKIYYNLKKYYGFSNEFLFWLGQTTAYHYQHTTFANKFKNTNLEINYACFLEEVTSQIEKSYYYKIIKLDANGVSIEKKLSKEIIEQKDGSIYGNQETCFYSLGFATSVGYYSQAKFPNAKLLQCLYLNANSTIFNVDFKNFTPPRYAPVGQSFC